MKLWEEVRVGGSRKLIPFERRILWIRESSTELTLVHRGAEIDRLATFNDWYGFLTSLENGSEAKSFAKKYKIQSGDVLQISACCTITDTPHLPDESPDGLKWNETAQRKKYIALERDKHDWKTSDVPAGEYAFGDGQYYPRLESIEVAKLEGVLLPPLPASAKRWIEKQREAAHKCQTMKDIA
jgi:hypothetical protein